MCLVLNNAIQNHSEQLRTNKKNKNHSKTIINGSHMVPQKLKNQLKILQYLIKHEKKNKQKNIRHFLKHIQTWMQLVLVQ